MKLSIMGFDNQIEFNDYSNTILCIQEYNIFSSVIFTINDIINNKNETNEIVLLDEKRGNTLFKSVQLITDPFSLDLNSRAIQKSLFSKIEKYIINEEDEHYQFQSLVQRINKIILDELDLINIDFSFNSNLTVSGYLKAIGLKITKESLNSVFDLMYNYIEIISELLPETILIFCNCLCFLTDDEISELCKHKNYKHLNVLFIEQSLRKLSDFKSYVINDELLEYII